MGEDKVKRLEDILVLGVGLSFPLYGYLSTSNFVNGIDKGYGHSFSTLSYILIGVYMFVVLSSDLFMLWQRKFELSIALRKYWGSAFVATILVLLLHATLPETGDEIKALCLLYTPYVVLTPFLEFLRVPVYGDASLFSVTAVGSFCLLNWAVCRFVVRGKG